MREGTEFLDLGTWADEEDPGAGPQGQDSSRLNGNWFKIDKFAKENKMWVGTAPPPAEHTIEHTLWLDISNISLPVMKKWKDNPGEWIVLWTWKHGDLQDLEDDQHPQYLLRNGTRKLDANYTPEEKKSIATKEYVDALLGGWSPYWGPGVQDLSGLRAIPDDERIDKQVRYVEDKKALYGYNAEGNPITLENQIENCDDAWNQYVFYQYDPGAESWIESDIDSSDKQEGAAAIKLTALNQNGVGNPIPGKLYASESISPIDLRNHTFIRLWVKPSFGFTNRHLYLILTNGVIDDNAPPPEEVRLELPSLTADTWQEIILYFSDATVTGGNINDILSNVVSIGLRLSLSESVEHGSSIMIDDIRAFQTVDNNENYIVPDDLIGVWEKISDLTNPLKNDLDAGGNKIISLGAPTNNNDAVRKIDLDEGLNQKADIKDYPLKWIIDGFITDGAHIDTAPSDNGYSTGEKYAVNHSGNNHNGNVYRVKDDDTWELLEARSKGLGVLLKSSLTEYYYSSVGVSGWWNDNLSFKQDKPSSAVEGNIAVFNDNKNTVDSNKKIETTLNNTDNEVPTSKAVKTYVDSQSGGTDLGIIVVKTETELQQAVDQLSNAGTGSGGGIYVYPGTYLLSSAIQLRQTDKRIIIFSHGNIEFVRPGNEPCFKFDTLTGNHIYSLIGLGFSGAGKTGAYPLIETPLISGINFNKFYMHRCRFSNNSYHAFRGRIYIGIVTENSFFNIDGYAWYGGFLGGGTIYANNLMRNEPATTNNNAWGFLYSNDGNGIYFRNNNLFVGANGKTIGSLVYAEYGGTILYGEVNNNVFNLNDGQIPSGKYMVEYGGSPSRRRLIVTTNTIFGTGGQPFCNLATDTSNSPHYVIVENNYGVPTL